MELWIYIKKHRFSIKAFADSIGYSRNMISGIANNKKRPSLRLALVIEKATNGEVTAAELLAEKKKETLESP